MRRRLTWVFDLFLVLSALCFASALALACWGLAAIHYTEFANVLQCALYLLILAFAAVHLLHSVSLRLLVRAVEAAEKNSAEKRSLSEERELKTEDEPSQ